ncbi:MAG: LemA family protein [Oscillospiraceae bacterium]|jgi:LemA protein|nr:LemA family protein [Oscillospiraceae bacterium]
MKKMSIKKIVIISALSCVAILVIFVVSAYNSLAKKREIVVEKSAGIDTQIQRRLDLIPKLVNSVKAYLKHEEDIFKQISDARSKLAGASSMHDKAAADEEANSAISRLLVITENYPNLKANSEFAGLRDELAGTENRISVARGDYNQAVQDYNGSTKTFPSVMVAGAFGFSEADYFKADKAASKAPDVNFD